jgi:tRNA dimethylallyltransferase
LAKVFNTVILSADSRQFYREMSIGTAKPSIEEMHGVKHYFIDSHSIAEELTAATFAEEANTILEEQFKTHPIIILTGGSGMYMDALCKGLDNIPVSSFDREKLNQEFKMTGLEPLLKELESADPLHFQRVDRSNPVRVIRALEVIRYTGKAYSTFLNSNIYKTPFEVIRFRIEHPREQLYARIDQRVDIMMALGLLEEVRSLLPYRNFNALRTVGYRELFDYLDGETDLRTAVELIKQHSRNYAKRQLTWLRKHPESIPLTFTSADAMCKFILDELQRREIQ